MNIGDLVTVPYEQSKQLRKEGRKPRNDVVVMMCVGKPEQGVKSNIAIASSIGNERQKASAAWTAEQHDFVARKLVEASA